MALCPILIIHHQNFKNEKKDKRNSTVNLSDDSEESDELVQEGTNDKDVFLVQQKSTEYLYDSTRKMSSLSDQDERKNSYLDSQPDENL